MVNKKAISFLICLSVLGMNLPAQNAEADTTQVSDTSKVNIESKFPSISLGAGVLLFSGDIGKGANVSNYSHIRGGYHFSIEKRFNASFGLGANALYGKLSSSERSNMPERNLNFESPIIQVGLQAVYHLDNNYILKRSSVVGPYVSVGFSYLKFDPHGDLIGDNDLPYYYWTDGTIRDVHEDELTKLFPSNIVKRDHDYETTLTDSTANYSRTSFSLPLSVGVRFQLNDHWEASVATAYHIAFTDYIDNVKGGSGNDAFLYSSFSLTYNFALKFVEDPKYQNIDFESIEKLDSDKDGVPDANDMCLNTPPGIGVDKEGCPVDDDKDGVPDYLDKEPNTKKGTMVNSDGIGITEEIATQTQNKFEGGISRSTLEFEFADADKNTDGFIDAAEMRSALDNFFAGKSSLSLEKIQRLIQFFVRQ